MQTFQQAFLAAIQRDDSVQIMTLTQLLNEQNALLKAHGVSINPLAEFKEDSVNPRDHMTVATLASIFATNQMSVQSQVEALLAKNKWVELEKLLSLLSQIEIKLINSGISEFKSVLKKVLEAALLIEGKDGEQKAALMIDLYLNSHRDISADETIGLVRSVSTKETIPSKGIIKNIFAPTMKPTNKHAIFTLKKLLMMKKIDITLASQIIENCGASSIDPQLIFFAKEIFSHFGFAQYSFNNLLFYKKSEDEALKKVDDEVSKIFIIIYSSKELGLDDPSLIKAFSPYLSNSRFLNSRVTHSKIEKGIQDIVGNTLGLRCSDEQLHNFRIAQLLNTILRNCTVRWRREEFKEIDAETAWSFKKIVELDQQPRFMESFFNHLIQKIDSVDLKVWLALKNGYLVALDHQNEFALRLAATKHPKEPKQPPKDAPPEYHQARLFQTSPQATQTIDTFATTSTTICNLDAPPAYESARFFNPPSPAYNSEAAVAVRNTRTIASFEEEPPAYPNFKFPVVPVDALDLPSPPAGDPPRQDRRVVMFGGN